MKALGVILLAVVTSLLTTLGLHFLAPRFEHVLGAPTVEARPKHAVPQLVGLSEVDAKANLDALGFKLLVGGRTPSVDAKEGSVIDQSPKAGESIAADESVTLTFAVAPPKVPNVVGKTVAEASEALTRGGYVVKVGEPVPGDKVATGLVASQSPSAGDALPAKGTVTIQPAAGAPDVKVPKLVGMPMQLAKTEAEKANLKLTIQWADVEDSPGYQVLRQDPAAGATAKPGAEVKIVVNREQ